ncbi:transposase [Rhizobium leguminosarum bv. viciae]|nr:transposase [Rhizobium leguminosarum bv. viciae]NKL08732.1 transposase [Rhizobium leguminosarum bv. viciae]NKL84224.1 transposase [Rhizobium leguminosarum bv. viciae]NKL94579.1 transposase [Rhizobium leguminosarum bv. viciae]NKM94582.1 transposase [Rhizobium leguminosarum bv. viciae]
MPRTQVRERLLFFVGQYFGRRLTSCLVRTNREHEFERSGAHWQHLPERYGRWKSIHARFT